MTMNTRTIASSKVIITFSIDILTNGAVSYGMEYCIPFGKTLLSSSTFAFTASDVLTALPPGLI